MGAATLDAIDDSSSATLLDDEAYPELDGDEPPPFSKMVADRGAGRSFGNMLMFKFDPTGTHFDNSTPLGGAINYLFIFVVIVLVGL